MPASTAADQVVRSSLSNATLGTTNQPTAEHALRQLQPLVDRWTTGRSARRWPSVRAHGGRDRTAVRRLVDKDEIVDLVHRYSYYVDHNYYDDIASLFTEDCVVDYGPGVGPPIHGRRAFRAMFGTGRGFVVTSHHNANVLISFEGDDRASVRTSLYAWHETSQGTNPVMWGAYYDVVVRTPEGWRFAQRELRVAATENWWQCDWHPLGEAPKLDV